MYLTAAVHPPPSWFKPPQTLVGVCRSWQMTIQRPHLRSTISLSPVSYIPSSAINCHGTIAPLLKRSSQQPPRVQLRKIIPTSPQYLCVRGVVWWCLAVSREIHLDPSQNQCPRAPAAPQAKFLQIIPTQRQ